MKMIFIAMLLGILSMPASALTLKKGQVIGGDGGIYNGASPEQAEQLAKAAQQTDFFGNKKSAGVVGNNLFIVVEEEVVFVPLADIGGKSKEAIKEVITDYVVKALTANVAAFHSGGASAGEMQDVMADIARDTDGLADSAGVKALADQAVTIAEKDATLAAEWVAANVDIATVDAANDAARQAAEKAFEAVAERAIEAIIESDPDLQKHMENGGTVTCDSAIGCYAE